MQPEWCFVRENAQNVDWNLQDVGVCERRMLIKIDEKGFTVWRSLLSVL